jgi:hypothetical protein
MRDLAYMLTEYRTFINQHIEINGWAEILNKSKEDTEKLNAVKKIMKFLNKTKNDRDNKIICLNRKNDIKNKLTQISSTNLKVTNQNLFFKQCAIILGYRK